VPDKTLQALGSVVKLLILDVDGVLTDGGLYYDHEGNVTKRFNVQDGLGIKIAQSFGLDIAVITGLKHGAVEKRVRELGITEYHAGHVDKVPLMDAIRGRLNLERSAVAYLGDDWVDAGVMGAVGLPMAVSNAQPEITSECDASFTVDGHNAMGQVIGVKVMDKCIEKAKKHGVCFATVNHASQYGFGGYYAMYAADRDMIGFTICNSPNLVAAFGGSTEMLGTNPLSVSIPAGKHTSLVVDMATSVVAKGKIALAMKEGKAIPDTWALDKNGNPTTDPVAANSGVLLPMGGPKGYGLALIIDVICSCLAGANNSRQIPRMFEDPKDPSNVGYFMGAIDISKFVPVDEFKRRADSMFDELKAAPVAHGFKEIMIPGEIEYNSTVKGKEEGIDLSDAVCNDFKAMAEKYGVKWPVEK